MHLADRSVLAALSLSLALLGCADDPSTLTDSTGQAPIGSSSGSTGEPVTTTEAVEPTTGSTGDSSSGSTDDSTTGSTGEATTGTGTDTTADTGSSTGDDPVQACIDGLEAGDACGQCSCEACLEPMTACQAEPGCMDVRACARAQMCNEPDCLGPCAGTINIWGGLDAPATTRALALGDCAAKPCAAECV